MRLSNRSKKRNSELAAAIACCRTSFTTVFLFSIVANILMLAFPLYMLQIYDRVLTTSHTDTLLMLTLIVVGALLLMSCIDGLRTALTLRIGGWLAHQLGPIFLESSVRAQLSGRANNTSSLADLTTVRNFISTQGLTFFCDAPWVPIYVAIIWLVHPVLGMLALGAAIALLLLSFINEYATRAPLETAAEINTGARRDADAMVRNAEVASAMGMMPALISRWENQHNGVLEELRRAGERSGLLVASTKFVRLLAQVGVLGLGALLVIQGSLTAGAMIACSILLGRALAPVELAMGAWRNFTQARIAFGKLRKQLEEFPTIAARTPLPEPEGRLSVGDLVYDVNGRRILDRVTFNLEPGDAVAVIGPSAAGKSTLCRFLVGLDKPTTGEVRLDGSEITHWDQNQLGQYIGFLPQSVELFAGTVRENISRMSNGDGDKVTAAARLAHAHEMIQRLPDGYDTRLGDGGLGLSAGQRQRIGLARAVYGHPRIIVLDEPNANLDQAGESALAAALSDLKQRGAAVVMVGHRPSTLAEATKILLLKDGGVKLFGPREEVLAKLRDASAAQMQKSERTQSQDSDDTDTSAATENA